MSFDRLLSFTFHFSLSSLFDCRIEEAKKKSESNGKKEQNDAVVTSKYAASEVRLENRRQRSPFQANVVPLKGNFVKQLENAPFLILFHAPWCRHCKKMYPLFDQVVETLEKEERNVHWVVAHYEDDGVADTAPLDVFRIRGFPTVVLGSTNGEWTEVSSSSLTPEQCIRLLRMADKSEWNEIAKELKTNANTKSI